MIKINLLPIKATRKREYVKQQLILGVVLVLGAIVGCYMWYSSMSGKIEDKQKEIATAQQQIEQYKKAIGEVEKYKGLEAALNRKLRIIDDLEKGKTGPVRILDHLSQIIPKQVWLMAWEEKSGTVKVEGEALTNKHVAEFITALKKPAEGLQPIETAGQQQPKKPHFFTGIRLLETTMSDDKEFKRTFIKFKINLKVNYAI
jgi:type IV pilus assembly protein PilN